MFTAHVASEPAHFFTNSSELGMVTGPHLAGSCGNIPPCRLLCLRECTACCAHWWHSTILQDHTLWQRGIAILWGGKGDCNCHPFAHLFFVLPPPRQENDPASAHTGAHKSLGRCIWMHLVNGTGNNLSLGRPTLE